jgi:hypothetical protein
MNDPELLLKYRKKKILETYEARENLNKILSQKERSPE